MDWKVGQLVAFGYGRAGSHDEFSRIKEVTARKVILENGYEYALSGYRWGASRGSWSNDTVWPVTEEQVADAAKRHKRRQMENRMMAVKWRELTDEQLERVIAALPAERDEKERQS